MQRKLTADLIQWRNSPKRKPLIVEGARQVGKTYLLQAFGREQYKTVVYVNFDRLDPDVAELFSGAIQPTRIIDFLAIKYSTAIDPQSTLIIFDEVQELPRALSSLKYFAEDAPEYHIVAAGSLLGVTLHPGTSFPVGKVDFLRLEPLSFEEFCWANSLREKMHYTKQDIERNNMFKSEFADAFQQYMVVGGMPRAVVEWYDSKDMNAVDEVLGGILSSYRNDFSKHTDPTQAERMSLIWQSIPSQFAKENRRFVYGVARPGARAREYEMSIAWLVDAGLVRRVYSVSAGDKLPLEAYKDPSAFKLYLLDLGLLRVLAGLSSGDLVGAGDLFNQFNGLFAEQFVLQQLADRTLYYWTSGAQSEVDFVTQVDGNIIPMEVKSGENVKGKSLRVYREKYRPELAVRFSMKDIEHNQGLLNIPLYQIWLLDELL
ncbi:MAG: AAA family ATPase [Candidatus Saccharimonadales bacterium]